MAYQIKPMKAPRAAGGMLHVLTFLVENPVTGALLAGKLLSDAGVLALRAASIEEPLPTAHPLSFEPGPARERRPIDLSALARKRPGTGGFAFETVADFAAAYRTGGPGPEAVAERVLAAVRATEEGTPLRALIAQDPRDVLAQARASAERFRAGKPLGPLDGVPVAVKDELDQRGYGTTVGTRFLGKSPATLDAEVVARLRSAGAVLIGKTNMHEIGIGVTGLNPHHGACRNPYDPTRSTGGSSSGSAASVAAGLCPIAVSADGGGSIRIPAALCGLVGLKATFGRVSEHGAAALCWSVAHVGPIAATAADAALAYALMAGPDPRDPGTLRQPAVELDGFEGDVSGVRLGIYRPWFEHAEPAVVAACDRAVQELVARGARIVEIGIPDLELLRAAHLVTIVSEMASAHLPFHEDHLEEYGLDTRLALALARRLQAFDYVQAQRLRGRLSRSFRELFERTDVILSPTTGRTAPLVPRDALATGESNLPLIDDIMRFAPAANLTGLPAISFPVGYDGEGLPIGLQALGRPWEEELLLRLARVAEGFVERRAPQVHHRLLGVGTRTVQ